MSSIKVFPEENKVLVQNPKNENNKDDNNNKKDRIIKAPRIIFDKHHIKGITATAVLPMRVGNCPLLLSGGEDKVINVWSVEKGSLLLTLDGHSARVSSLMTYSFDSDNNNVIIVSSSWDETIRVWPVACINNLLEGEISREEAQDMIKSGCKMFKEHKNRVSAVEVIRVTNIDGKENTFLISASLDNTMRVYDFSSILNSHVERFKKLVEDSSKDNDNNNNNNSVELKFLFKIYDLEVTWWMSMKTYISSTYGPLVLSGGKDHSLRVWKIEPPPEGQKESKPLKYIVGHSSRILNIDIFEEDGQPIVITTCRDFLIRLFSLDSTELIRVIEGHTSSILSISLYRGNSGDANSSVVVVSACVKGNVRVWSSQGELLRIFSGHTDETTSVTCFPSPDDPSGFVVVSGSKDKTLRTWLYAEEKSITLLEHGIINPDGTIAGKKDFTDKSKTVRKKLVKVMCVAVYSEDDKRPLIVTGCDDSSLRVWELSRSTQQGVLKWAKKIHTETEPISCVKIYYPPENFVNFSDNNNNNKLNLSHVFVLTGSRDGTVCATNIIDGTPMCAPWSEHAEAVTCISLFRGFYLPEDPTKNILPFFVSGSEDNKLVVAPLYHGTKTLMNNAKADQVEKLDGHEFDVTDVIIFFTPTITESDNLNIAKPGLLSPKNSRPNSARSNVPHMPNFSAIWQRNPIIISGSMDNSIKIWSYPSCTIITTIDFLPTHVTSLAILNGDPPVLAAGGGDGVIRLWSLRLSYNSEDLSPKTIPLTPLEGHRDEVQSLVMYEGVDGADPVLVSGSWDTTMIVWSLKSYKRIKILEGHKAEITCLTIFSPGGTDMAVASASIDGNVRVLYDFLAKLPKTDVIKELYKLDRRELGEKRIKWNRISELVDQFRAEQFFTIHFHLFIYSLEINRHDFLVLFLPLTFIGLRKACMNQLLQKAIHEDTKSLVAAKTIVNCWCQFLGRDINSDQDLIYTDPKISLLQVSDLISLSKRCPFDFIRLICSIKLISAKKNKPFDDDAYYFDEFNDKQIKNWKQKKTLTENEYDKDNDNEEVESTTSLMWLPLHNPYGLEMLMAFSEVCDETGSVEIFNSEAGMLALKFAWIRFGLWGYVKSTLIYLTYVAVVSFTNFKFLEYEVDDNEAGVYAPIIIVLLFDLYFFYDEFDQMIEMKIKYFYDFWNQIDFLHIAGNTIGCILRLIYQDETDASRAVLAIASIAMWFNVLYYLRAFELTGPLVSMILKIAVDIIPFLIVLLLVILGFSQAFWLLSDVEGLSFSTIDGSLITSFTFMLGGYDNKVFEGTSLYSFSVFLSCIYMLIVSILLLNLLIALMGDSYQSVRENGLAQWRLEQAQLIIEQRCLPDAGNEPNWIYVLKNKDNHNDNNNNDKKNEIDSIIEHQRQNNENLIRSVKELLSDEMNKLREEFSLNKTY